MPNPFPPIKLECGQAAKEDSNPAIQLFGRRFFVDQTVAELLLEFLLVASSPKRIGEKVVGPTDVLFPSADTLQHWPRNTPLEYATKSRLNLKLFGLLGASKLETRHATHREHYHALRKLIQDRITVSGDVTVPEILKTLENLFLGFQRIGGQRTWCAQSFLPIRQEMLAGETIWKASKAKRDSVSTWKEVTEQGGYFQSSQHIFLARGGEALYLQLCNMLRQSPEDLEKWSHDVVASHSERERCPEDLRKTLSDGLNRALSACPSAVGSLATFIDEVAEPESSQRLDFQNGAKRYTSCGWCPEETWPESLLFAVDLVRLCDAAVDPIERMSLLETACAMQVLRTLCAQSARYTNPSPSGTAGALGFVWAVSDPEGNSDILKRISRRSVNANLRMIQRALRTPEIVANVRVQNHPSKTHEKHFADSYRDADSRYGHKLFLALTKRLGLVVPRRGSGARFILTDHLLRYLVLTTVRPGQRITYETFMEQVFERHGMALGRRFLSRACHWCGAHPPVTLGKDTDGWLEDMLSAAGMFVRLSDSCSMVENPFGSGRGNSQ